MSDSTKNILAPFRAKLFQLIIEKWQSITGHNPELLNSEHYLSNRDGGPAQKRIKDKQEIIPIRDCMLMQSDVEKYVLEEKRFRSFNKQPRTYTYTSYTLYETLALRGDSTEYTDTYCPLQYLNSYAIFIKKKDFKTFVEDCTEIEKVIRDKQIELIYPKDKKTNQNGNKKNLIPQTDLLVNDHFCGIYEAYFLSPEKEYISKLYLLICFNNENKDYYTYARSNDLENSENSFHIDYYEGRCRMSNEETLSIHFRPPEYQNKRYEFLATFDISDRKINFNSYLKGIYAGSDPTNDNKPVAGRMILYKISSWEDFNKNRPIEVIKDWFLTTPKFKPKILDDDEVFELFKRTEVLNKDKIRKHFKEFFIDDTRYIENREFIKKYLVDKKDFKHISGEYSIFSLHSQGKYINQGILKINSLRDVDIKGSLIETEGTDFRTFKGIAEILPHDILSIVVFGDGNEKEVIYYLLKIQTAQEITENKENNIEIYFNGIKMMVSLDHKHKPFASRVVFYKETTGFFDSIPHLQHIPIFPVDDNENILLNDFKDKHKGLLGMLHGFENNIIKSFSQERLNQDFVRDINYGELYFLAAKHFAKTYKKSKQVKNKQVFYKKIFLHLYFAQIHYFNESHLIKNDEDFKELMADPDFSEKFAYNTVNSKSYFVINEKYIQSVKRF